MAYGGQGQILMGYDIKNIKKRLELYNSETSPFRPVAIKKFKNWWDNYSEREIAILTKVRHAFYFEIRVLPCLITCSVYHFLVLVSTSTYN